MPLVNDEHDKLRNLMNDPALNTSSQTWLRAIYDQLIAAEDTLRDFRLALQNMEYRANKNAAQTIRLDRPVAKEWKTRITTLLGDA